MTLQCLTKSAQRLWRCSFPTFASRIHWQGSKKILRHDYCIDAFVVLSMAADRLTAVNQPLLGIRVSPTALRSTTGTKLSENTSDNVCSPIQS
jgi:hypothetical protein